MKIWDNLISQLQWKILLRHDQAQEHELVLTVVKNELKQPKSI